MTRFSLSRPAPTWKMPLEVAPAERPGAGMPRKAPWWVALAAGRAMTLEQAVAVAEAMHG